jgi:GT2 family glycosyltransferase
LKGRASGGEYAPDATVVIASFQRPEQLSDCLKALSNQQTAFSFSVTVIDDRSNPPLRDDEAIAELTRSQGNAWQSLVVLRGAGVGPAQARQRGVDTSQAPIIMFTDDDTIPSPQWIESACGALSEDLSLAGVDGPTIGPYDRLYERGVHAPRGGGLTCNIAYRRSALVAAGGFWKDPVMQRVAAAEDIDLAHKVLEVGAGPIAFSQSMIVVHPPRKASFREIALAAWASPLSIDLQRRHPSAYASHRPRQVVLRALLTPTLVLREYVKADGSLRKLPRVIILAAAQTTVSATSIAVHWSQLRAANRSRRGRGV